MRLWILAGLAGCHASAPPAPATPVGAAPTEVVRNTTPIPPEAIREAKIQLGKLGKNAKVMWNTMMALPLASSAPLPAPAGTACGNPDQKFAVSAAWASDTTFTDLDFQIDEPTAFTYQWFADGPQTAHATATADLDCDGVTFEVRLDVTVVDNNMKVAIIEPPPDSD